MDNPLIRVAREPLLHFLLIGAFIYVLYAVAGTQEQAADEQIVVTAGEVQWLADSWQNRWYRLPTRIEFDNLLRSYVRERVLAQEASVMGLDQDDMVIRRRLAQRLEMLTRDMLTPAEPDPQELVNWFETHKEQYRDPVLYTVTQIFFDPDKRGAAVLTDAQRVRDELNTLEMVPEDLNTFGDPFMLQSHYPAYSAAELGREFGTSFASAVVDLEPGSWLGPVVSGFGVHVVLVSERRMPSQPVFSEQQQAVTEDWIEATTQSRYDQFETELIERYQVRIEESELELFDAEKSENRQSPENQQLIEAPAAQPASAAIDS